MVTQYFARGELVQFVDRQLSLPLKDMPQADQALYAVVLGHDKQTDLVRLYYKGKIQATHRYFLKRLC